MKPEPIYEQEKKYLRLEGKSRLLPVAIVVSAELLQLLSLRRALRFVLFIIKIIAMQRKLQNV